MSMKSIRIKQMEEYILEHDLVSMEKLRDTFNISMNTVRLDVAHLVKKGTVRKIYGGVCSNQSKNLIPFEERQTKNSQEKKWVGKAGAKLIEDGDFVYIDSGSTTMYLMDYLGDCENVTIITNSLNVINRALLLPKINIISLPGTLERKTNSFVSADAVRALEKYNIKKAFMASSGISDTGMITNSSPPEYEIKKAAIANCQEVYLMIDSSKYGKSAMMTYAELSEINKIIVDYKANSELLQLCERYGVEVILAQEVED